MFRKEEAAITDWSQETVEMCARRQADILNEGAKLLHPGGRMVYSTCTFAPEENEQTIAAFLACHPDFALEDVSAPWFTRVGVGQFRLWPHKLLGEGHFAAVLRKLGDEEAAGTSCAGQKLPKEWLSFA
jgi:16S rRNA C967 or C1407 C5-methylase (RsmB/RsmF family)